MKRQIALLIGTLALVVAFIVSCDEVSSPEEADISSSEELSSSSDGFSSSSGEEQSSSSDELSSNEKSSEEESSSSQEPLSSTPSSSSEMSSSDPVSSSEISSSSLEEESSSSTTPGSSENPELVDCTGVEPFIAKGYNANGEPECESVKKVFERHLWCNRDGAWNVCLYNQFPPCGGNMVDKGECID